MSAIEADVTIIGGGLIGCMTAHQLRRRGRSVVVLERGLIGGASSGVSFGSLRLQGQHGVNLALAARAQEIWEGVEGDLGESVEFAQHGHVHLALNPEQVARLEANARELQPLGMEAELLDRREMLRRWPFLGGKVLAASWSRRDAVVNPRLVAPAFARAARRLGATILEETEVVSARSQAGNFVTETQSSHEGARSIHSATLVNAAGAWGTDTAAWFDDAIPSFAAGPCEMVTEPVPAFVQPVIHVVDGSVLFRQTQRGNVIIGGHPRLSVDARTQRARVPPSKIVTNLARLGAIAPHLTAHHVVRSWTGIEGYLPDMMPAVGPSLTTSGLFHACAFSGHGLQAGPAAAAGLADLIAFGTTDLPIAPFGLERFRTGSVTTVSSLAEEFQNDVLGLLEHDGERLAMANGGAAPRRRVSN